MFNSIHAHDQSCQRWWFSRPKQRLSEEVDDEAKEGFVSRLEGELVAA